MQVGERPGRRRAASGAGRHRVGRAGAADPRKGYGGRRCSMGRCENMKRRGRTLEVSRRDGDNIVAAMLGNMDAGSRWSTSRRYSVISAPDRFHHNTCLSFRGATTRYLSDNQ